MDNLTTGESMRKRSITTVEMKPQTLKQLRELAKKRERTTGFAIRKAIDFWLANGAPEEIPAPKTEAKKP